MQNKGRVGAGEFGDSRHFADEGLVVLRGAVGFGGGRTFRIDDTVRSFARSPRSHGLQIMHGTFVESMAICYSVKPCCAATGAASSETPVWHAGA